MKSKKDSSSTNPVNKKAVTLFYNKNSPSKKSAPMITAKGEKELAQEILAIAKEHNIPIFENPGLAAFLNTLELGDEIPPLLYLTIAEIIAFAYALKHLD